MIYKRIADAHLMSAAVCWGKPKSHKELKDRYISELIKLKAELKRNSKNPDRQIEFLKENQTRFSHMYSDLTQAYIAESNSVDPMAEALTAEALTHESMADIMAFLNKHNPQIITILESLRKIETLQESKSTQSWKKTESIVHDIFKGFSPDWGKVVLDLQKKNRIDAEVSPEKTSAIWVKVSSVTDTPTLVFEATGHITDTTQYLHGLGHAVQVVRTSKTEKNPEFASTTQAEVAALFAIFRGLDIQIQQTDLAKDKLTLYKEQLDTLKKTLLLSSAYYFTEKHVYENTCIVSPEQLSSLYQKGLQQLAPLHAYPDADSYNWIEDTHLFYKPFFSSAYMAATLIALSLVASVENMDEKDAEAFMKKYCCAIEKGGAVGLKEFGEILGQPVLSPEFWEKGFDYLNQKLTTLNALTLFTGF